MDGGMHPLLHQERELIAPTPLIPAGANSAFLGVIDSLTDSYTQISGRSYPLRAVRNEIQKRLPKEWSEEEIAQLAELWELRKEDDDPVDMIYNGLTITRPKPKIKEKLLELGLVTDRKELRKKRSRKSNQGKSSWEAQSVSNSDENESSDEEAGKSSRRSSQAPNKLTNRKTKKCRKKEPTVVYTDAQLSGLMKDVIEKNMELALVWIQESLQDILDDPDEESTEGIPLVPLTDYSSAAMDSPSFQKLLRAMGFTPPVNEQESYWRIPANMLTSMIQKRCNLIDAVLAGNFVVEESTPRKIKIDDDRNSESEDDVDILEHIKKYFASKEPEPSPSASSKSDVKINIKAKSSKSSKVPTKSMQRIKVESDGEEIANSRTVDVPKNSKKGKGKSNSRVKLLADSSDSEHETETNVDNVQVDEGKRNRSDSSENENETTKKRRLLDSEEGGPLTSQNTEVKRTRLIISDDEEEPTKKIRNQPGSSRAIIISDDED
ncbi:Protein timeless like protein [Dufourea novaeangliae]|uniref:Protein timeless like protein n=1 Tax=Dufourea novaeangliae TaxID=178035 RepID=A0A154PSZ7_DUFNO|nr:Protein timeless like protein [Dufourea novaeangliae]